MKPLVAIRIFEELFAFAAGAARADARNVLRVNMEVHGDCTRIAILAILRPQQNWSAIPAAES
jgi:hypothetical protein